MESEVIAAQTMAEIASRTPLICVSLGSSKNGDVNFLSQTDLTGETPNPLKHIQVFGNLSSLHLQVHDTRIAALTAFRVASTTGTTWLDHITPTKSEAEHEKLLHCIDNIWGKQQMTEKVRVCAVRDIDEEDVIRFDHGDKSLIIIHGPDGNFYAADGHCTHELQHLSEGIVDDFEIECPLHFGAFDYRTGDPTVPPVCEALKTYPVSVVGDDVIVEL